MATIALPFSARPESAHLRMSADGVLQQHDRREDMRSEHSRILWSSAFSLLLAVMGGVAQAGPKPLPTNSNAYGEGYAESTAGWLEWLLSIPNATSPLFDTDGSDAAVGQSGKVWFLVGNGSGGDTERTVTVPAGKALFFPIVNFFWVNLPEWGDAAWSPTQEAWVRDFLADTVDTAQDLVLEIDGQPIANVSRLRVSGAVGACTLPVAAADNIFGVDLSPGAHECVADGYWALLLSAIGILEPIGDRHIGTRA